MLLTKNDYHLGCGIDNDMEDRLEDNGGSQMQLHETKLFRNTLKITHNYKNGRQRGAVLHFTPPCLSRDCNSATATKMAVRFQSGRLMVSVESLKILDIY
jgi:hypothetical protein